MIRDDIIAVTGPLWEVDTPFEAPPGRPVKVLTCAACRRKVAPQLLWRIAADLSQKRRARLVCEACWESWLAETGDSIQRS